MALLEAGTAARAAARAAGRGGRDAAGSALKDGAGKVRAGLRGGWGRPSSVTGPRRACKNTQAGQHFGWPTTFGTLCGNVMHHSSWRTHPGQRDEMLQTKSSVCGTACLVRTTTQSEQLPDINKFKVRYPHCLAHTHTPARARPDSVRAREGLGRGSPRTG